MALRKEHISVPHFLPHYDTPRPFRWEDIFQNRNPVVVEIGSGLGEFLTNIAAGNPDLNFIGIERDWNRVKKTLKRITAAGKQTGHALPNVKVMKVDAVVAFDRLFPPESIKEIFSLFPCPWPKKSHIKHRLFKHDFFRLLNSRLRREGTLRIVTDYRPFFEWMQEELRGDTGFVFTKQTIAPQFNTKFEKKWIEEGHKHFHELRLTKQRHCPVGVKEDVELQIHFIEEFDPRAFHFEKITGDITLVLKDFLYDPDRQKAAVYLVAAEKNITQHVWISITRFNNRWCVAKTEGHAVLPTKGVARAIAEVAAAARRSAEKTIPAKRL